MGVSEGDEAKRRNNMRGLVAVSLLTLAQSKENCFKLTGAPRVSEKATRLKVASSLGNFFTWFHSRLLEKNDDFTGFRIWFSLSWMTV